MDGSAVSVKAWNNRPSLATPPAGELKRFHHEYASNAWVAHPTGEWVRYEDAQAANRELAEIIIAETKEKDAQTKAANRLRIESGDLKTELAALRQELAAASLPDGLHSETADLVRRFSKALAKKLLRAQEKYGVSNDWAKSDWMDKCRADLVAHIQKGDPLDVAAFAAFIWHHGESTTVRPDDDSEGLRSLVHKLSSDIATLGEERDQFRDSAIAYAESAEQHMRQLAAAILRAEAAEREVAGLQKEIEFSSRDRQERDTAQADLAKAREEAAGLRAQLVEASNILARFVERSKVWSGPYTSLEHHQPCIAAKEFLDAAKNGGAA